MDLVNIFSLHGSYFSDDENRFTANIIFLLSEFRQTFLMEFLRKSGIKLPLSLIKDVRIQFQTPHLTESRKTRIPDAEIWLEDKFHLVLEAKIGTNPLDRSQLLEYAEHLRDSAAKEKRLICVTQHDCFTVDARSAHFQDLRSAVEPAIVPLGTCVWMRWNEILDLLKSSFQLTPDTLRNTKTRTLKGKPVKYDKRLASLFLEEVETTMYDKKNIDTLRHGEIEDIVLAVQKPWFMNVALTHRAWFPNNLGGRVARYVAHYETSDPESINPGKITYIARNRVMWNGITIREARGIDELKHTFKDAKFVREVEGWKPEAKHCIVLTDDPIRLREPIPMANRKFMARIMAGWYISFAQLRNAKTLDDFQTAAAKATAAG
jgi:hypothetical protein